MVLVGCGPGQLGSSSAGESASTAEVTTDATTDPTTDATTDPTTDPSTSSETGESTTATSMPFVPNDDDHYGTTECDPFMQDCPEGEKCVPYASTGGNWDAFKCVSVLGDQAVDEPCTYDGVVDATDDCDASSYCWHVDEGGEGWCRAFCTGSADDPTCAPGSTCLISGSGIPSLCIPTCHPLVQDCPEGTACFWANVDFNCIFTTQDIPAGDPCGFINDCAAGNVCINAESLPACEGSACCSKFCALGQLDEACAVLPGTSCLPFFEENMEPPGYEDVGICIESG